MMARNASVPGTAAAAASGSQPTVSRAALKSSAPLHGETDGGECRIGAAATEQGRPGPCQQQLPSPWLPKRQLPGMPAK